jgi:hypothetical protein
MTYSFESPDFLCIQADIGSRWRRLKNTHGFVEQTTAETIRFKVQVAIYAWPNWLGVRDDEFPLDSTARFNHIPSPNDPLISYYINHAQLALRISVPHAQTARLPRASRPGFYRKPTRVWGPRRLGYWLSVLGYFLDEKQAAYPDILEFDTQFYSAGLPELGKRN